MPRNIIIFCMLVLAAAACSEVPVKPDPVVQQKPEPAAENLKPILRLDTGGHTSLIRKIAVTSDKKYLISCSDDKTIRVWDIQTKKEVRKILGEIGDSFGMIYAIALSPDDQYLAVGGFLADNPIDGSVIRIYHFPTSELRHILKSHSDAVYDLSFSTDGRYLVSGSYDCTVKIWDARNGFSLIHTFKEHQKAVYAVRIFPYKGDYRIVSAAWDNQVIMYSLNQKKKMTWFSHEGKADSLAVSEQYIASTGWDNKINMFDHDLKHVRTIDSETRPTGLAFSPDGKLLLAGTWDHNHKCVVYHLEQNFKLIQSFNEHKNYTQAVTFSDNETAITGGGDNRDIYFWNPRTGQIKGHIVGDGKRILSVATSGDNIRFGDTLLKIDQNNKGKFEKTFDLSKFNVHLYMPKDLLDITITGGRYKDYTLSHSKGGDYGYDAILLIQKNGEVVRRIIRDGTNGYRHNTYGFTDDDIIISGGMNGSLKAYNLEGEEIADFIGHTGEIWSIAIDGDRLVSGGDDQIIKLWDLKELRQGKRKIYPILSLFVSKDSEWVVWTEEGFFNASPGGQKYIGYHINHRPDKAAEYVGVAQLYDLFYRPDLIAKRLQGGYEKEIQAELSKIGNIESIISSGLPPELEAKSPKEVNIKSRDFTLDLKITDKGGGIGKIVYRVDGIALGDISARPADIQRRAPSNSPLSRKLTLTPGKHFVEAVAFNAKNEIESKPVGIFVNVNDPMSQPPNLYALCIGISAYRDRSLKLKYAAQDALLMAEELEVRGKALFEKVSVKTLTERSATLSGIEAAFGELEKTVKAGDVFVLYLAGHGMTLEGDYHFIPWDLPFENMDAVREQSLNQEKFQKLLAKIPALKSLVILDTCGSGGFSKTLLSLNSRGIVEKTALDKLMRATGRAMLAASSEIEQALEGHKEHGVFTYILLEGLKGKADTQGGNNNGSVEINELADYVREEVPKITQQKWGYQQIPMRYIFGDPFAIGCREGTRCK